MHAAHDGLERLDVVGGVAVELDVADVAGVRQRVVGRFLLDLLVRRDGEPHGNVERVRVVLAVGHAGDLAVALLVHADEAAGQALGGRGEQAVVEARLLGALVAELAHVADDLEALLLHLVALAVVVAVQRRQRLGQADEADGQAAVAEHLAHLVVRAELVRVEPDALAHQERIVVDVLRGLNLEAVVQLLRHELEHRVKALVELLLVALRLDGKARQVDGREREVAARIGDLRVGIGGVRHHARAASHRGHFRLGVAGLVVLQVEGRVEEHIVREQALRAHLAGVLEEVEVGVAGVVVDALFHLEDVDGENRRLAVAEARVLRFQDVADGKTALGAGVRAVVDGRERRLGAGAGVHRIEVVHEALHGLIRLAVGAAQRAGAHVLDHVRGGLVGQTARVRDDFRGRGVEVLGVGAEARLFARDGAARVDGHLREDGFVVAVEHILERVLQTALVELRKRLAHALGHRVVEVRHALTAVLVVLVGLDGNGRQRRVARDALRLAQITVARREAAVEQAQQVDLAARRRQRVEVEVVDVDVALAVGLRLLGREQIRGVVRLRARRADLEHRAHRRVAVDVRIVALHVRNARVHAGDLVDGAHQAGVRLADARAVGAVQDELLGSVLTARAHQLLLHRVLDLFDLRRFGAALRGQAFLHRVGHLRGQRRVSGARSLKCLQGGGGDFRLIVQHHAPVALDNALDHGSILRSLSELSRRFFHPSRRGPKC